MPKHYGYCVACGRKGDSHNDLRSDGAVCILCCKRTYDFVMLTPPSKRRSRRSR
jgi:hypothetical protein